MFGLNLGVDLLDCLRKYANDKNVSMSVIVKTLVKNYLIEKGQYVQRNSVEDNGNEDIRVFKKKPTFNEIYPLINCSMIEIQKAYLKDDHKTYEMYCDEEAKLSS
jgi:hypothetical protein